MSFATGLWADSPVPEKRLTLVRDADLPGGDIQSIFDTTLTACQTACLTNESCVAFTFNTRSNACFPKSEVGEQATYEGAFSGFVLRTPPRIVALGEERAGDLDFLRQSDLDAAKRMASAVPSRVSTVALICSPAR
ncbi:MAG: PAN/Apple domain-containing protein [Pseudomonadota bacterium]